MAVILVSVFFGGMMAAALFKEYSVYKLSVPFFIVSWAILLIIHEFGHALMARTLGWKVEKVSIGSGKFIGERRIFGMVTEFHAIPLSGFVVPRPTDLNQPQLKNFLIYLAGPGIEIIFAALITVILGPDILFDRHPDMWIIFLQSFSFAAAFGAIINLVPFPHASEDGGPPTPSDGLGMILAWKIPDDQYGKWIEENHKR
jgi:Zn-dependent protease